VCGIVGYLGPKECVPVLISGLEKLEYRGYDSAGVARIDAGKIQVFRAEGKLERLKNILRKEQLLDAQAPGGGQSRQVSAGIGHTRWATHGRPSETNAHPHVAGKICLVHNGIIENYIELKDRLQKEGCRFLSETDTEIAAHLINYHYEKLSDLRQAVRAAVGELRGSYALVVMSSAQPDRLVVAKNATPVIVGIGNGEMYVASDIPAFLEHTRQFVFLEDG